MTLKSVQELLTASQEVLAKFQGQPWWRGQALDTWRLVPKVYRNDYGPLYEHNIAMKFAQRAPTRHTKVPPPGDLARWLFLAQHYGLPTRLLDWTESPLLALFFTVWEDQYVAQPGAIWAIDPFKLNQVSTRDPGLCQPGHPNAHALINLAFSPEPATDPRVVALVTEEVDLRMLLQLSGFTIHGSPASLDGREDLKDIIFKFVVDADSKAVIRMELQSLGIRERTVFPDLAHLATDLARDRYR